MLEYLKNEANRSYTENGAVTYASTGSDCMDLFATIGAMRSSSEQDIVRRFVRAFTENPDMAMKTLFFARDVRGGLGERNVFRVCLGWLARNAPASARKNIPYVAEFGRWDDLLSLIGTPCERDALQLIQKQLEQDLKAMETGGEVSLLAKWLPSVNASNAQTVLYAKRVARFMGMSHETYRKTLAKLRGHIGIIENNLRQRDYSFDYSKQPSRAMLKYRKAFMRNDRERYIQFLSRVSEGKEKMHADAIMPYELVETCLSYRPYSVWHFENGQARVENFENEMPEDEKKALNAAWASLPCFAGEENALAVIDTSASMLCGGPPIPAAVALSLGLYFAERSTGAFSKHFIEFSSKPQLIEIKGETFVDRVRYVSSFCQAADTNLEAVFDLVLNAAIAGAVPQDQLPGTLYIISDMEFNCCVRDASATNFENAKARFASHGYRLPKVVFWNVQSRNTQQPVRMNEQGVALVSGCTPRIFDMVSSGAASPMSFMLETLASERYAKIAA